MGVHELGEWAATILPIALGSSVLTAVINQLVTRRKLSAETATIKADAADKIADTAVELIEPLKYQIKDLREEIKSLREQNREQEREIQALKTELRLYKSVYPPPTGKD